VDEYQDLIRLSVAGAGNDHRLGEGEAPPAIMSMFLGDDLTAILAAIENGNEYKGLKQTEMLEIGVKTLPRIPRDTTDRNRTSPFAFTGNKFEFRMPGSSLSAAGPCFVLNTVVADVLERYADSLEGSNDFIADVQKIIKQTISGHKRIIMNGNNYSAEWEAEAEKRGLSNLKTAVEAYPCFIQPKNIAVFGRQKVLSEQEIHSRYEILLDNYSKTIRIEALTMLGIARNDILPVVASYQHVLAQLLVNKKNAGSFSSKMETDLLDRFDKLTESAMEIIEKLEKACEKTFTEPLERAFFMRYTVSRYMNELRLKADEVEKHSGRGFWPMPSYGEMLNSI
jgi:glutamine synthetase